MYPMDTVQMGSE